MILADLAAGLEAFQASLYRVAPDGSCVTLVTTGVPAATPLQLPDLPPDGMARSETHEGQFAIAAADGGTHRMLLAVRRAHRFTDRELHLVRATLRGLVPSQQRDTTSTR
jgi:hypothetical protein